jgi:hypothetical protein
LATVRNVVNVIRNFLALGVGTGVRVEWISAYASRPQTERDLYFGHVDLIYPMIEPELDLAQSSERILSAGRTTKGSYLEAAQTPRNDQAHLLVPPPANAAKGADLLRIEAQSQALLEALLYLELGLEDTALGDMLWRGRRLDRIRLWAPLD